MSPSANDPFWQLENGNGSTNDDGSLSPAYHRPWPHVSPESQRRFEQTFLADGETINFDAIPKLPFLLRHSAATRMRWVLREVAVHSEQVQRPLTGAEANAVSEHSAYSFRYAVLSLPVAVSIAMATTFAGKRTFKFPLYQPKMKRFDPFSFPTKRMPLLKGRMAAGVWHGIRLMTYCYAFLVPTSMVFVSIANTSFREHVKRDPRLISLIEEARRKNRIRLREEQLKRRAGIRNPAGTVPQNPQQMDDGAYQDKPTSEAYGHTDYASQPSRDFERPSTAAETSKTTQPSWARSTSTQSPPPRTQNDAPPSYDSRQDDDSNPFDDDDDDDDDDASPVASSARRAGSGTGPSSSSGSSWERMRQQARSGTPDWEKGDSSSQGQGWARLRQDKTRNPKDSTPKTDSYSYSGRDEERERRKYEKEQAQKEFDALIAADSRDGGSSK
ncbi:hypothetical protein F5B18DRAFT_30376 [Nemania serpens]|nr:hypothetical protein F5B18DRAFT_30376 [Nemania serpens]